MPDGTMARMTVEMTVNAEPVRVDVVPSEALATTLRDRLRLTGTKVSCDVQACGACTVLVDGLPRSACTYLTYEARDRDVLTVEGLGGPGDRLDALQEAFIEDSGFQCGFCTPGMLLAARSYLDAGGDEPDGDLLDAMNGNLCRCTGYMPIVAAILRARDRLASGATNTER